MKQIKKKGAYTLYVGGNVGGRPFYATGPGPDGVVRTLASFWKKEAGLSWSESAEDTYPQAYARVARGFR